MKVNQEILILVDEFEIKVAVVENRQLVEFYFEEKEAPSRGGNIYLGLVHDILPGMEASFIDIGDNKNAYLFLKEYPQNQLNKKQSLKIGQKVIVQITKDHADNKGPKTTGYISLAGRFLVLLPFNQNIAVSKKLEPDRDYYYNLAASFCPSEMGLIVRTAAHGANISELKQDLTSLMALWEDIKVKAATNVAPCLLYQEANLAKRAVRDFLNDNINQVLVDDKATFNELEKLLTTMAPAYTSKLKLVTKQFLDEKYKLQEQLQQGLERKVWLRSGGYITIDKTEALTAIDVNTGKYISGSCFAQTVFTTNLEAAQEIARQIRLRDLGGLIVIDFIDMKKPEQKQELLAVLNQSLINDRSHSHIVGISDIGLVEMTRKSIGGGLERYNFTACPYCENGLVKAKKRAGREVYQQIKSMAGLYGVKAYLFSVSAPVKEMLVEEGLVNLLEQQLNKKIFLTGTEKKLDAVRLLKAGTLTQIEKTLLEKAAEK